MFVYSVKSSKIKTFALIILVVAAILIMFYISKEDSSTANDGGISLKASNAEERIAFLSQFGWKIDEDPVEVCEVIIPSEFNEEYERYNTLQKEQNLDLTIYSGKRVKQYTFTVLNYPGYEKKNCVQANILIYEGLVIGGDISSIEQNGFMQTFDFPDLNESSTEKLTQKTE